MKRSRILAAASGLALTGGLALASPAAMAQTPGGSASQNATINIASTLSMTTTLADFTLTSANISQGTAVGGGSITAFSTDPNGEFVDLQGPVSFGSVPTSDVFFNNPVNSGWSALSSSPVAIFTDGSAVPGGSTFTLGGYYLNVVPSPGVETGVITETLYGN